MLSKKNREKNKSRGPWGMINFNFSYRKTGETISRNRFISAPSKNSAIEQFNAVIDKAGLKSVEIISIVEVEE